MNNTNKNTVCIILVNYKNWYDTVECLESIIKNKYENFQIIVVDNYSQNESIDKITQWAMGNINVEYNNNKILKYLNNSTIKKPIPIIIYSENEAINGGNIKIEKKYKNPIILIKAKNNRGFAAGNNIGIQYALKNINFNYILLLNNDTVIEPELIKKLVTTSNLRKSIGIVGSKIYYYNNPSKIWFNGGKYHKISGIVSHFKSNVKSSITYSNFITGCCMLIKREVLEKVGFLDESYFMYVEDLDYCYRTLKCHYKIAINHEAILWHKVEASSKKIINNYSFYMNYKNLIVFNIRKNREYVFIPIIFNLLFISSLAIKWIFKDSSVTKTIFKGMRDAFREIIIKHKNVKKK